MRVTLYTAFTAKDGKVGQDGLWGGVESPVRAPFDGKYGLKLEVAWFVWQVDP
jgi:hypothetical protein